MGAAGDTCDPLLEQLASARAGGRCCPSGINKCVGYVAGERAADAVPEGDRLAKGILHRFSPHGALDRHVFADVDSAYRSSREGRWESAYRGMAMTHAGGNGSKLLLVPAIRVPFHAVPDL